MTSTRILTAVLVASFIGAGAGASASDTPEVPTPSAKPQRPARLAVAALRTASSTRICRADEDTLRVLKLTTFDGGVRVDYEFVVSGRATWTHMNRPLLRQFGIRAAGTFCLPKDTRTADDDYD